MVSIGQLAETAGVNVQTIRYYERRGLIATPPRTASGYRQYPPETAERLQFIKRAQALGFTLEEIRELLELRIHALEACTMVEARTREKIAQVDTKLRELGRLRRVLERLAISCEHRTPTAECPVLEMLAQASHDLEGTPVDHEGGRHVHLA